MERTNGVVEIELKGEKYKMCFDMNALFWLEETFDISFDEMQDKLVEGKTKISDIVKLLGAALQYDAIEKGQEEYSIKDVKKLIAGEDINKLAEKINEAMGKLINQ